VIDLKYNILGSINNLNRSIIVKWRGSLVNDAAKFNAKIIPSVFKEAKLWVPDLIFDYSSAPNIKETHYPQNSFSPATMTTTNSTHPPLF